MAKSWIAIVVWEDDFNPWIAGPFDSHEKAIEALNNQDPDSELTYDNNCLEDDGHIYARGDIRELNPNGGYY